MELLCLMRELNRMTNEFESQFQQINNLCLNEGMVLCILESESLTSGAVANKLGLSTSNTSKVLCSLENKGLINRVMGNADKRQMYFTLSDKGKEWLNDRKKNEIAIPEKLKDLIMKIDECIMVVD